MSEDKILLDRIESLKKDYQELRDKQSIRKNIAYFIRNLDLQDILFGIPIATFFAVFFIAGGFYVVHPVELTCEYYVQSNKTVNEICRQRDYAADVCFAIGQADINLIKEVAKLTRECKEDKK